MISIIIAQYIGQNIPSLTIGDNLFSEQSTGNRCVTIITTHLTPWPGMPQNFRQALIEVEVKGYSMSEAYDLASAILMLLDGMPSGTILDDNVTLRTIQPKQLPCFAHDGTRVFSFRVYFVEGE